MSGRARPPASTVAPLTLASSTWFEMALTWSSEMRLPISTPNSYVAASVILFTRAAKSAENFSAMAFST